MSIIAKHLGQSGGLIEPFSRATNKSIQDLKVGESETDICEHLMHIVEWDGDPPRIVKLNAAEIKTLKSDFSKFRGDIKASPDTRKKYREKCFLWVITSESFIIAREKIRNIKRSHDSEYICHTNLTSAGKAYIGGELFFGEDGIIYVNNFSDRYGGKKTPPEIWEAAICIMKEMGYQNVFDILNIL